MNPSATVVIVTYASAESIAQCLRSVDAERHRLTLEIVVVDSASPDKTVERVRTAGVELELIELTENRGFAHACNVGAARARGRHVVLLNPDAALRPRALAELVTAAERDPSVGVVGPRILDAGGRVEPSWGAGFGLLAEAWSLVVGAAVARSPFAARWLERRSNVPRRPAWVSGACLLTPRALWRELGGLDERFFLYMEDVDLCARARAAGRDVVFWPTARVVHRRGGSTRSNRERARLARRQSQLLFHRKHHGVEGARLTATLVQARLLAAGTIALILGATETRSEVRAERDRLREART